MSNQRTRRRTSPGAQPLGRFLADLNWMNTPRLLAGRVPLAPGSLQLNRFLGIVNWRGAADPPDWPTSGEETAIETIDQSSQVASVFAEIAWD